METYQDLSKNYYKVGCNFDFGLIDLISELNEEFKDNGQIVEMYGSTQNYADLSARPKWRLQDLSNKDFEKYIQKCNDHGLKFNYTMNSIYPYGSKVQMVLKKKDIQNTVKWLEDIGVYRITIANPMMAMFIREVSNIELELSCISHVDTVTQLQYYHETFGINKFCNSLLKNRNKEFLETASWYCRKNGIILELLAQEFCGVGGVNKEGVSYATHCAFRDSCYLCHATNETKEDSMLYNNYPMNYCMGSRNGNEESWLKMRWIRPEDQKIYRNACQINYFKLTGRTGSLDYLEKVMRAYLSESFDGNLIELWKPLETIYNDKKESDQDLSDYIDNKKLDGFIDHWMKGNGFECENELCGTTCEYCRKFYEKHLKNS